jgi:hypothetical protein
VKNTKIRKKTSLIKNIYPKNGVKKPLAFFKTNLKVDIKTDSRRIHHSKWISLVVSGLLAHREK